MRQTTPRATLHPTPIGELLLLADNGALTGVRMDANLPPGRSPTGDDALLREAAAQLDAYFAGRLTRFDLPVRSGGTPFQEAVWRALREVPYGETASYRDLAVRSGHPRASRAVGAAMGRNAVSIILPCHRIVGSDGSLAGYGGGLERKRFLLSLEARTVSGLPPDGG